MIIIENLNNDSTEKNNSTIKYGAAIIRNSEINRVAIIADNEYGIDYYKIYFYFYDSSKFFHRFHCENLNEILLLKCCLGKYDQYILFTDLIEKCKKKV